MATEQFPAMNFYESVNIFIGMGSSRYCNLFYGFPHGKQSEKTLA